MDEIKEMSNARLVHALESATVALNMEGIVAEMGASVLDNADNIERWRLRKHALRNEVLLRMAPGAPVLTDAPMPSVPVEGY